MNGETLSSFLRLFIQTRKDLASLSIMVFGKYDRMLQISPRAAFLLVSLSLGQLGDGLNIFQGIYLVGIGWNEGSVGLALSLMGLTSLIIQPWAGDWVDKTTVDRRVFNFN